MHRLERGRGAAGAARRAFGRGGPPAPAPSDPAGLARLREWAWKDLQRVAFVSYRVEKPEHDISASREETRGRVRFTVGGFNAGGARVERSADVLLACAWDPRQDPTPLHPPAAPPPGPVPVARDMTD